MSEHDDDSETKKEVEALLDRLASRGEDGDAAKAEKLREFYALDPDDPLRLNFVHLRLLLEPGLADDEPPPPRRTYPVEDRSIEARIGNYIARLQGPWADAEVQAAIRDLAQEPELFAPENALEPNGLELQTLVFRTAGEEAIGKLAEDFIINSPIHHQFTEILARAYAKGADAIAIDLTQEDRPSVPVHFRIGGEWHDAMALSPDLEKSFRGALILVKTIGYTNYRYKLPQPEAIPHALHMTCEQHVVQLHFYPFKENQKMIQELRETFPVRVWPKEKLAAMEDSNDLDCRFIIEHFQGRSWVQMTRDELGYVAHSSWTFDEDALCHFLPAYLQASLEKSDSYPDLIDAIAGGLLSMKPPLAQRLSEAQCQVAHEAIIRSNPYAYDQDEMPWGDPVRRLVMQLKELRSDPFPPSP